MVGFSSYDLWKTREPAEECGPVCDDCGDWLRRDERGWYCERCDDVALACECVGAEAG